MIVLTPALWYRHLICLHRLGVKMQLTVGSAPSQLGPPRFQLSGVEESTTVNSHQLSDLGGGGCESEKSALPPTPAWLITIDWSATAIGPLRDEPEFTATLNGTVPLPMPEVLPVNEIQLPSLGCLPWAAGGRADTDGAGAADGGEARGGRC